MSRDNAEVSYIIQEYATQPPSFSLVRTTWVGNRNLPDIEIAKFDSAVEAVAFRDWLDKLRGVQR